MSMLTVIEGGRLVFAEAVLESIRKRWMLLFLMAIAIVVSSYNMFGFPMFHGDEGIYTQQAYAVAHLGRLSYYTYFYDHAPIGWIQIALWYKLTGLYTFGELLNSTRVFMLVIHGVSLILLFQIVLTITNNRACAALGGLIYALSPLSIFFGRIGLLDNIMMVWLLAAIYLLVNCRGQLLYACASGACFGIAVLCKVVAIPLLPAFLLGIWVYFPNRRKFAYACWLLPSISLISGYFLFALFKDELFPSPDRVSLLRSIAWQSARKGGLPWSMDSDFAKSVVNWLTKDAFLIVAGSLATLYNLFRHQHRFVALTALFSVLAISRGNQVFDFYIASIYPLLIINLAIVLKPVFTHPRAFFSTCTTGMILAILVVQLEAHAYVFSVDVNIIQRQAVAWVRSHVPPNAVIMIDDKLWTALHAPKDAQPYKNAHSHWKVARDPDIFRDLLKNDWRNIEYIVADIPMFDLFRIDQTNNFRDTTGLVIRPFAVEAFLNSFEVARFEAEKTGEENWLAILRVNSSGTLLATPDS
jgi:hypothetical protein